MGDLLKAAGIQTCIHYPPIHRFAAFRQTRQIGDLPKTDVFAARELTLPLYPPLSHEQVDAIADAVLNGVAGRRAQARSGAFE